MLNRKGFTLIELLIVVVIIGILAAIAIPKFSNTKEKAVVAGLKSDLRNLATAQEAYYADHQEYGDAVDFAPSSNNDVSYTADGGLGWSGTASSPSATQTCSIGVGSQAPSPQLDGVPVCN
jgi:type IV pilus assembly protein PilA